MEDTAKSPQHFNFYDFTQACRRTWRQDEQSTAAVLDRFQQALNVSHATDGICTEAGEIKDIVKAFLFYNRSPDRQHIVEELGDILHYIAIFIDEANKWGNFSNPITIEEAMTSNIRKLKARYPEGFSETSANNRDKENEYKAMECNNE